MKRVALLFAVAALHLTSEAGAQDIPRPDTLGAQFDETKPGTATPADFDYLLGTWRFRHQARDPQTGKFGPVNTGFWTAQKTHEGFVVEDQFSTDRADGGHGVLMTYRVYDTTTQNWTIQGILASRGGPWHPGTAWSVGPDRVMVQWNSARRVLQRIRYYSITKDHFLWRSDGSLDSGRTWVRDVQLIEATRVKP